MKLQSWQWKTKLDETIAAEIVRITNFWKENCPEHHAVGVNQVSNSDLKNSTKFYFNRHKEDLVCMGPNILMIKLQLRSTMKKANRKVKSSQHVHKCKDAILWGGYQHLSMRKLMRTLPVTKS